MVMRLRPETTTRHSPRPPAHPSEEKVAALIALTYELLDAHSDTTRLDMDGATDGEWRNHLAYLRDLQRVGREALAGAGSSRP
jgi:hypothetical protein